ncbi:MAG: hypothetical protein AB1758_05805 [Candidatus Eremiobacterota bacterium]
MTDFRALIQDVPCWDRQTEWWNHTRRGDGDVVLQNREELIGYLEFIQKENIRSYLEVGVWTGRLLALLQRIFRFDKVAAADIGWAQTVFGLPLHLPPETIRFQGSSHGREYEEWRRSLGHFDLVMIDGDHSLDGVRRDFEINRRHPHRFLAFHDIVGGYPGCEEVRMFWQELQGNKLEIVRPHPEVGSPRSLMGIGIWWE